MLARVQDWGARKVTALTAAWYADAQSAQSGLVTRGGDGAVLLIWGLTRIPPENAQEGAGHGQGQRCLHACAIWTRDHDKSWDTACHMLSHVSRVVEIDGCDADTPS